MHHCVLRQGEVLKRLREMLAALEVPDAARYRSQDLRRGHNEDMVEAGSSLKEILCAGGWLAEGSHRPYTDLVKLEMRVCAEAHSSCMAEDDDSDDGG